MAFWPMKSLNEAGRSVSSKTLSAARDSPLTDPFYVEGKGASTEPLGLPVFQEHLTDRGRGGEKESDSENRQAGQGERQSRHEPGVTDAVKPEADDGREAAERDRQYAGDFAEDRKSTRLNSSHSQISYAV